MADTTVKVFQNSQNGAPVINGAGTLIEVLDACLVNGWGVSTCDSVVIAGGVGTATISAGHAAIDDCVVQFAGATGAWAALNGERKVKSRSTTAVVFDATGLPDGTAAGTITMKIAPAGWQKVFAGTNKAVYRSTDPTSTQTYLRVDDSNAQYARPMGYLSMTDIDTGTNDFGSASYWNRIYATTGGRNWWLIANKSMFYFGIQTHATEGYAICAFGDGVPRRSGDAYRAVLAGANAPVSSVPWQDVSANALIYQASTGFSVPRSYTQLGGEVYAKPMGAYQTTVQSGFSATLPFPNGGDNSVIISQAEYGEIASACLRGRLPGLYFCPQRPNGALQNDFKITGAADFPGKTLIWKLTGSSQTGFGGCAIDVTGPWL